MAHVPAGRRSEAGGCDASGVEVATLYADRADNLVELREPVPAEDRRSRRDKAVEERAAEPEVAARAVPVTEFSLDERARRPAPVRAGLEARRPRGVVRVLVEAHRDVVVPDMPLRRG